MASAAVQLSSRSVVVLTLLACGREAEMSSPTPIGGDLLEQTFADFPDCTHPAVNLECSAGWCRVPAGCFIMGSPETEWTRGAFSEDQVAVTLTHPFLIQQHELTQAEWMAHDVANPSGRFSDGTGDCLKSDCPVGSMNWFEAVAFANLYSARHEPPLPTCYRLLGCTGEIGQGMTCTGFELTAPTLYDCDGYRLPTEAEWEYAARAGTRTTFYTGDITRQPDSEECVAEPNLDSIAWYCRNSSRSTHPVMQKRPNGWGLFDMLGNVYEWVHDTQSGDTPPGSPTNPGGGSGQETGRLTRGGCYRHPATYLRAASGPLELSWNSVVKGEGVGMRLVRTLRE